MENSEDENKLAEETLVAFFSQFKKDEHTKLVLELVFKELLNAKNLSTHGPSRQISRKNPMYF